MGRLHRSPTVATSQELCQRIGNDRRPARDVWLAGVDGCPGGWIAAFVRPGRQRRRALRIVQRFRRIAGRAGAPAIVAVDMPIGLPERTGQAVARAERACGRCSATRSQRRSIPSRCRLRGCRSTRFADLPGSGCRKRACTSHEDIRPTERHLQSSCLRSLPKIREVDELARERTAADRTSVRDRIRKSRSGGSTAKRADSRRWSRTQEEPSVLRCGVPSDVVERNAAERGQQRRPARRTGLCRHRMQDAPQQGAAVS